MATLHNIALPLPSYLAKAKFRAMTWHKLRPGKEAMLVGYGLEVKLPGDRIYHSIAWEGQPAPFDTKRAATEKAKELTELAAGMASVVT